MAERLGLVQGLPHQGGADAEAARVGLDGERSEQQAHMAGRGDDGPEPQRAGEAAAATRDECEAARGLAAFAQALRDLGKAARAERRIEQSFALGDVGAALMTDGDPRLLFALQGMPRAIAYRFTIRVAERCAVASRNSVSSPPRRLSE